MDTSRKYYLTILLVSVSTSALASTQQEVKDFYFKQAIGSEATCQTEFFEKVNNVSQLMVTKVATATLIGKEKDVITYDLKEMMTFMNGKTITISSTQTTTFSDTASMMKFDNVSITGLPSKELELMFINRYKDRGYSVPYEQVEISNNEWFHNVNNANGTSQKTVCRLVSE